MQQLFQIREDLENARSKDHLAKFSLESAQRQAMYAAQDLKRIEAQHRQAMHSFLNGFDSLMVNAYIQVVGASAEVRTPLLTLLEALKSQVCDSELWQKISAVVSQAMPVLTGLESFVSRGGRGAEASQGLSQAIAKLRSLHLKSVAPETTAPVNEVLREVERLYVALDSALCAVESHIENLVRDECTRQEEAERTRRMIEAMERSHEVIFYGPSGPPGAEHFSAPCYDRWY